MISNGDFDEFDFDEIDDTEFESLVDENRIIGGIGLEEEMEVTGGASVFGGASYPGGLSYRRDQVVMSMKQNFIIYRIRDCKRIIKINQSKDVALQQIGSDIIRIVRRKTVGNLKEKVIYINKDNKYCELTLTIVVYRNV